MEAICRQAKEEQEKTDQAFEEKTNATLKSRICNAALSFWIFIILNFCFDKSIIIATLVVRT